jgi:Flp pilus assembly pilin Flp
MFTRLFNRVYYSEIGASMVEYALLVMLIAIVGLVSVNIFGTSVAGSYSEVASSLEEARP